MEILISFLVMALWVMMVLMSRIVTTTVHELGHAIPALFLTDKKVVIHIGSYGDTKDSFLLSLGRLKAYFKFNWLQLNMGLCMHQNIPSLSKNMVITLGGPLNSLIFALILIVISINNDFSEGWITLIVLFIISAVWDFVINLIPTQQPSVLTDGRICYNDGQQMLTLWQQMSYPAAYSKGTAYQIEGNHELAIKSFKEALKEDKVYREIYQALANSQMVLKDYEEALETYENLHDKFGLLALDYAVVGHIYIEKKEYMEAIEAYNFALYIDFKNSQLRFKRGLAYQELAEHATAIQDFDSAIFHDPQFAKAYAHRGLSKLRLDDMEGAILDLKQAEILNTEDPYLYLYFGFYYQKMHDEVNALASFQKAKDMKIDHYGIDYYIHGVS